ncbi:hypothetical protein CLOM621_09141, partial [Clostridium sp. M62/1]
ATAAAATSRWTRSATCSPSTTAASSGSACTSRTKPSWTSCR